MTGQEVPFILVLGLGNDLVADDALGPRVVQQLQKALPHPSVRYQATAESGLRLLDYVTGFRYLLVVDVLQDPHRKPGTLLEFSLSELPPSPTAMSLHSIGLHEVLATGRALGLEVPGEGRVLVVVAKDLKTLGASMSSEVAQAVPRVVHRAQEVIRAWLKSGSSWKKES